MLRILIAECKQEVSSFNPVRSHYSDFHVALGQDLIAAQRGAATETGGAIGVFDTRPDVTLIPTMCAQANTSGGPLAAEDWTRLSREWLTALEAAPKADGVYFCLHGAMQAENENDPEGYLLEQARGILGEEIPIVISMDLHGIMTDRMLRHADAIVVYHTYPHVDFKETGERAARLLLKILDGEAKPVTAVVPVPALVRGDELITDTGLIRHVIQAAEALEDSRALAAGMFWGNPFTDVPELRSNSIVVTNGDEQLARSEALRLADLFWEHHEKMQVPLTSIEGALKLAASTKGTTILMDAADATSSGASGDSNAIIRGVVESGYRGKVLAPVVDPAAVRAAFEAGVGATIRTTVGGALDTRRYQPLPVEAKVRLLSDGQFRSESFGWNWDAGDTAVLEADNLTLVVTTKPVSLFDRSLFWSVGQEPKRFDLVVVKSPHCEPQMFRDWCGRLINVDAPGSTSANLKSLGHTICERPVFPLDADVRFERKIRVYRRG